MAYKNYPDEEREKTSWHIIAQNSDFVISLLKKATGSFQRGDFSSYFWVLTSARDNINYALNSQERKSLDETEIQIVDIMSRMRTTRDIKEFNKLRSRLFAMIRKYHHAIMDILEVLGYFPKKENREKMRF